ncbi:related to xylosidase/arabinosidase [Rhynchosporium agropyri]|uniref:Related to xylosidase/arabinosidase n=1 Tax=Rhynchosporium agropyri TaxID=914238 RepID=A0A1E1L899_9HELO|nr:related to xylosidase/arabinosidase [Rhynchosporium agropyri]
MKLPSLFSLVLIGCSQASSVSERAGTNSTYYNPVLPGWHSDPSCTQVNGTFYCVTSTFILFPGLPIYASKDLINWKLVSHVWNRESQLPGYSQGTGGQQQGMYAATVRYNQGTFYVICEYLGTSAGLTGVLFKSKNIFSSSAWSDPVIFHPSKIDPDILWDNGKVYMATQSVKLEELDINTGALSQPSALWNGTGGTWPEGPHLYKKDGYYYLMIAEGGTAQNHAVTIARSKTITGPYEGYAHNPILTNRGTKEYFQTVGHADLFQDAQGNWWGICLATRIGTNANVYPMGRETSLFPVTWREGEWPILQPVRGKMSGWQLPPTSRDLPGDGPFNGDPDAYDFTKGSHIPPHFSYWRVPRAGIFNITDNGLQIVPSRNNLTGIPNSDKFPELTGQKGLSFIGRLQTDTTFSFSVDLTFDPKAVNQEAGITVFLTQYNHIDLGVVLLAGTSNSSPKLSLRYRAIGTIDAGLPRVIAVPTSWVGKAIRLTINATNSNTYTLAAASVADPTTQISLGIAPAELVSGGFGHFTGSLVGAYATCNGEGSVGSMDCPAGGNAAFQRWRYLGLTQQFSRTESIPSRGK